VLKISDSEMTIRMTTLIGILILIVFFLSCSAISSDYTITTPASLTTSFKIHKFLTAYDFNDVDIPSIASRFDLIDTNLAKVNQIKEIKNLNPFLKTIFYDNALTHKERATGDWYVRDAQTGSKLMNKDWGWYLMDTGNLSYRRSLANFIKKCSDDNSGFDGVFLDDVWGSVSSGRFYKEGTKDKAELPLHVTKYWRDNMKLLLIQIKIAIGRKLLIINTGAFNTDYLALSDGQMYEAFCHANWQPFGEYYPDWQRKLDSMMAISNSGKIYLAQSGILDGATDSQIKSTQKYCFAMFLLGANSNSYFYFKPSMKYRGVTYFPEWDVDIGTPIGNYRARTGTPLYEREFSKGLVVINPSSESVQINLGTKYKTVAGDIIDTIALGNHEGEILLKRSEN